MAKVYFAPYSAIKYVGTKAKVLNTSLARPKPKLVKGDIVIVDKKVAFNLVHKGFDEFVSVDEISFVKADVSSEQKIKALVEKTQALENEIHSLFSKNVELTRVLNDLEAK